MEWLKLLMKDSVIIACNVVITTLVSFFVNKMLIKRDKKKGEVAELKKILMEYKPIIDKYKDKIDKLIAEIVELKENIATVNCSQQDILRDRIVEVYNQCMEKGFMTIAERESLDKMYKQYTEDYHGNGAIPPLVEKLYDLPTEK